MQEETLNTFDAHQLILGEHDTVKPCTLFIARSGIIVVSAASVNLWTVVVVVIAFAVGLMGLLLRNVILFLGGLGVGILAGVIIALVDFVLRRRKRGMMKHFSPERILEMGEKNFEIRYEKIVKIEIKESKVYPRLGLFFPSFEEHKYVISFVTDQEKHLFILDEGDLQPCLSLIRQFAPKTVEIEGIQDDE